MSLRGSKIVFLWLPLGRGPGDDLGESPQDKRLYEAAMKKMKDIVEHPHHFKPLRHDLKGRRRVHIEKSFVLTFKIDEEGEKVVFLDLRHHDKVYKKR